MPSSHPKAAQASVYCITCYAVIDACACHTSCQAFYLAPLPNFMSPDLCIAQHNNTNRHPHPVNGTHNYLPRHLKTMQVFFTRPLKLAIFLRYLHKNNVVNAGFFARWQSRELRAAYHINTCFETFHELRFKVPFVTHPKVTQEQCFYAQPEMSINYVFCTRETIKQQ